jgi:hypothetical protein
MRLNTFFTAVAAKRLSDVEVDPSSSNQREFNGIKRFQTIFGDAKQTFPTTFLYLDDFEAPIRSEGEVTWYDARANHPTRTEYRLYYTQTEVSLKFGSGDLIIVARRADQSLVIVAAPAESTIAGQLVWLFGLDQVELQFQVREAEQIDRDLDFVARWILDSIGIELPEPEEDAELVQRHFGATLPSASDFSNFARTRVTSCDPLGDPDGAIMQWLETEERLFKAFERILIEGRLRQGFSDAADNVDVDGFIQFSLSVQNRRKARAGRALENHIQRILELHSISFARGAKTEGESKPDFLFPGHAAYHDAKFPADRLTVLGAKATCKDRWRQLLDEADRVKVKHLMTLEPSISTKQTDSMQNRLVQLIVPSRIHPTFKESQRTWLWTLQRFIDHARRLQA